MVKAMSIKSSNVLTFKITSSAGLTPQDICDALKMMPADCDVINIDIRPARGCGRTTTMHVAYDTEEENPTLIGKRQE